MFKNFLIPRNLLHIPQVILVTGGSGLVGKGIQHAIETTDKCENEEWIFLTSKDGNLLDIKATEALFEKHKPTHVIHLAALVCNLHKSNMTKCLNDVR